MALNLTIKSNNLQESLGQFVKGEASDPLAVLLLLPLHFLFYPLLTLLLLILLLLHLPPGELLEGDNAYFCEKCSVKRNTVKRMCIR